MFWPFYRPLSCNKYIKISIYTIKYNLRARKFFKDCSLNQFEVSGEVHSDLL